MPTPTNTQIIDVLILAARYLGHPEVQALPFAAPASAALDAVTRLAAELDAAPATPVYLAVYIGTTNDTNGGPRRGWYVSRIDGKPVQGADYTAWIEEGYGNFPWGVFAVRLGLSVAPETPGRPWYEARDAASPYVRMTGRINVTPGEYRDARKLPRFGGAA